MPRYLKSRARKTFDTEIAEAFRAIRSAFSNACRIEAVRVYVLSNAMLVGSAKLESYVEDLISDWVARVNASGLQTSHLPPAIRARFFSQQSVVAAFQHYVIRGDEGELNARVSDLVNGNIARFLVDGHPCPTLTASWLLHERKYPSPENWLRLFRRLGVPNVLNLVNAEAKADVAAMLVSFNDLRTVLAHQGIPPGLNVDDIRKRLRDIVRVVGWLDRVSFRQFGFVGTQNLWTT